MPEVTFPLSWSAVLFGWSGEALDVQDLRDLALEHLASARGEALIPLSELASFSRWASRADAVGALEQLARLEGWPEVLARREWLAARFQRPLDHLSEVVDPTELGLDTLWKVHELTRLWEEAGSPLDAPLFDPFIRSMTELNDSEGDFDLMLLDVQRWVDGQRQLQMVLARLLAWDQRQDIEVMAQILETMLENAQCHLHRTQAELNAMVRARGGGHSEREEREAANLTLLQKRRQRYRRTVEP